MAKEQTQFKKGISGNPLGKPKGILNSKTILERFLSCETVTTNPITGIEETLSYEEILHLKQIKKAMEGDLAAYKEIIERLEGKAQAKLDITTQDEQIETVNLSLLSDAQLRNLIEIQDSFGITH